MGRSWERPTFISPEQAQDPRDVDGRSDIYSLGVTLYFLLAGRVPFEAGSAEEKLEKHASADPTPLSSLRNDVPQDVIDVVARMIAKDPTARFQTPTEVAEALSPFTQTSTSVSSRGTARRRVGISVTLLCGLLVVAFGVFTSMYNTTMERPAPIPATGEETTAKPVYDGVVLHQFPRRKAGRCRFSSVRYKRFRRYAAGSAAQWTLRERPTD